MEIDITNLTIEESFPHVFDRQYFFVHPDEMVYLACACLIPLEVYIDGVVVIESNKPIGRIGTKHILSEYYRYGKKAFYKKVGEIMINMGRYIMPNTLLKDLIEDIKHTRLGFVPIVSNGMIGVVSIYDILRFLVKLSVNEPIRTIGSKMILIDKNASIRDALNVMIEKNIRRLFIREGEDIYGINDRYILDFIMSNEVIEGKDIDISTLHIDLIKKQKILQIKPEISIRDAIILLLKQDYPPALIVANEYVVTPLDIIMNVKYK